MECADQQSTSASSLASFDYLHFKRRQPLRSHRIQQSRHVDGRYAFGRMRHKRRMPSRYGRQRNDRNNHKHNVTHHCYWTLGLGASEPLAWNIFIKQQNAHRRQQA
jgi:hypothetical protein